MSYPYQSYAAQPEPPRPWGPPPPPVKDPTALGTAALVLAGLMTASCVGLAAVSWAGRDLFNDPAPFGDKVDTGEAVLTAALLVLGAALAVFYVVAYVVTCCWLRRCRINTQTFVPLAHYDRSAVWTWLGWWVPVVSLWFPVQVVRDVQRLSLVDAKPAPLGLWWAAFLVSTFTLNFASDDLNPVVITVYAAALLVSLVAWVRIVRQIDAAQRQRIG